MTRLQAARYAVDRAVRARFASRYGVQWLRESERRSAEPVLSDALMLVYQRTHAEMRST